MGGIQQAVNTRSPVNNHTQTEQTLSAVSSIHCCDEHELSTQPLSYVCAHSLEAFFYPDPNFAGYAN